MTGPCISEIFLDNMNNFDLLTIEEIIKMNPEHKWTFREVVDYFLEFVVSK